MFQRIAAAVRRARPGQPWTVASMCRQWSIDGECRVRRAPDVVAGCCGGECLDDECGYIDRMIYGWIALPLRRRLRLPSFDGGGGECGVILVWFKIECVARIMSSVWYAKGVRWWCASANGVCVGRACVWWVRGDPLLSIQSTHTQRPTVNVDVVLHVETNH